jgi:hypothetical protein
MYLIAVINPGVLPVSPTGSMVGNLKGYKSSAAALAVYRKWQRSNPDRSATILPAETLFELLADAKAKG